MPRSSRRNVKRSPPPPSKIPNNLPAQNQNPGLGPSILGNIFTGMTFGAGSSMGHRAVDAVMGGRNENVATTESKSLPCEKLLEMYDLCMRNEKNDCQELAKLMSKCYNN